MSDSEDPAAPQRQAADPSLSVFVTANAGSGKTKVLIDRIARLLLSGAEPSSFLCITYTKAAAAEMQRRLFERLGKWSVLADTDLAAEIADLLGDADPNAGAALARARALFARALETPGGLKIQTIHAFCERLIARFPLEAEVAPGFAIADEALSRTLLREAWAGLDSGAAGDAVLRFAARIDGERFEGLVKALTKETRTAREAVRRAGDLEAAFERIRERHGVTRSRDALLEALRAATPWEQFREAAIALQASGVKDAALGAAIGAAVETFDVEALCAAFHTEKGERRKQLGTKDLLKTHPWIASLFGSPTERLCEGWAELRRIALAENGCAALAFAAAAGDAYARAKEERGVLDFDDLIAAAQRLLTTGASAAWVLYKLDGRIDHILIDEGQDTSPAQWELIEPLQEEFFAGIGAREGVRRTVFAVGDPKQSIYSFQGADPRRFLAESQRLSLRAAPHFVGPALRVSFRSSPQVLEAVNEAFADLGSGPGDPFDSKDHIAHRVTEPGLVELWPPAPRPDRAEPIPWDAPRDTERSDSAAARLARAIAETIQRMIAERAGVWDKGRLRPMRAGDVLILVRSRGPLFEQILRALKRAGLPAAGADRLVLKDELAVQDLLACAKVALDPGDDLSLACVLKSPFVGLTDDEAELAPLARGRAPGERLIDRLQDATDPRYARARAFTASLLLNRGATPFSFFASILESVDGSGRSGWAQLFARLGADARDPVEELLTRALEAGREGPATLCAFVAAMSADESELKRELEEAGDAVRVMTVHGAKGLEAPIVFLPDTAGPPKTSAEAGVLPHPDGPILVGPADDDPVVAEARDAMERQARDEHLRLLYVAMTRARDRLIVCASQHGKSGVAESSWHARVQRAMEAKGAPCDTPFGPGFRLGEPLFAPEAAADAAASVAVPAWMTRPAARETVAERLRPSGAKGGPALFADRASLKRFGRGRLLHGLLQRLPDLPAAERPGRARAWLVPQGVSPDAAEALIAEAIAVLEDPTFAAVFAPEGRAEAAIAGTVFGRPVVGQVDRLVVTPEAVLIVDYKSDRTVPAASAPPAAYVRQLALYRAALQPAFPDRPVRCALLWTAAPRLDAIDEAVLTEALADFR